MTFSSLYLKASKCAFQFFVFMLSSFSRVQFFATQWIVALQAPLSMGFFRQEYWDGLPCPPPGDLPDPRIEPVSLSLLHWQAGSLSLGPPREPFFFFFGSQYLCEIFINHVTSILGPLCIEVMLCPAQEQLARVTISD